MARHRSFCAIAISHTGLGCTSAAGEANDALLEIDTYALTPDGQRIAIFYTKLYNRLLRPLAAADQPEAPPGLRHALAAIDRHVDDYITPSATQARGLKHDSRVQNPGPKALASMERHPHAVGGESRAEEQNVSAMTVVTGE